MHSKEGVYAWFVAVASSGINFLTAGTMGTYGILFVEFMDRYESTKAAVSIIASLLMGFNFAALLIGYLMKRFGHQPMGILAISLMVGSNILTIFAHELWVLYITFGIMQGFAFATNRIGAIIPLHKYFDQRKSLAIAVSQSGLAIGILVWPLLTWWLMEQYTLQGALIIIAGIHLHGLVFYLVMSDPDPEKFQKSHIKGKIKREARARSGDDSLQGPQSTVDTKTKPVEMKGVDNHSKDNETAHVFHDMKDEKKGPEMENHHVPRDTEMEDRQPSKKQCCQEPDEKRLEEKELPQTGDHHDYLQRKHGMVKTFQFITPVELWGQKHAPIVLGHMYCWSGAGSFAGFIMIGALLDTLREPGQVYAVAGSLEVLGGVMSLAAVWVNIHKSKTQALAAQ